MSFFVGCILSSNLAATERSRAEVRAFRAEHPCPATGQRRGACPGWHVDHIIPLCAGGPDKPANMQWITKEDHRFKTLVDVRECQRMRKRDAWPLDVLTSPAAMDTADWMTDQ